MKALEKISGINIYEASAALGSVKEVYKRLSKEYFEKTHPKLKILDQLIIFCIFTFVIQIGYSVIVGKDPFNSLLAGVFCSLGQFALSGKINNKCNND